MKKLNLFAMGLLATAAVSFTACSNTDDLSSNASQQQSVDGFYMTLQVKGSVSGAGSRTVQPEDSTKLENGTEAESTIGKGTLYIYNATSHKLVFTKTITTGDWKTEPSQTTQGVTKPIKVSVNSVDAGVKYNVYFLANGDFVSDPINNDAAFTTSPNGGANYATDNSFVMFNQNDESKKGDHSDVTFTVDNKSEDKPATASTIYLDRVVARIDAPTVTADKITQKTSSDAGTKAADSDSNAEQTKHIDLLQGVTYVSYAVSNLMNDSYVMQNWSVSGTPTVWTLNVPTSNTTTPYYLPYSDYGGAYKADGLGNFKTNTELAKTYAFENTTSDSTKATAMYFCIKANLTDSAKDGADFEDGTFYRYDNRMYTKISDIIADTEVSNPFVKEIQNGSRSNMTADEVLAIIKDSITGKLIDEGDSLAAFRQKYNIEVYREGNMYYRYAINDLYYTPTGYYSILRNSIYRVTVNAIYDIGKDVPNGEDKDKKKPNYYMNVKVAINPWVLNTISIAL